MFRPGKFFVSALHQITLKRFAGHSKWANIKHDKAIKDQDRATKFAKFSRMIRLAIQEGGNVTDPKLNSYLRTTIDQALKLNMPMATITNQIKKFNVNDAQLKKFWIEIKSMNKIFLIAEFYTENVVLAKNNTSSAIRRTGNTSLSDIKFMFDEFGIVIASKPDEAFASASEFEDKLTEDAINCDAQEVEDIDFENKSATFVCRPMDIEKVKRSLLNLGYLVEVADHVFVPQKTCTLTEAESKAYASFKQKLSVIEGFERVFDNVEPSTA